jgi:hypothetical protein
VAYVSDESGRNEVYMAPFPVYDLTADGQRFVMVQHAVITDSEAEPPQINIVLNWFEELKERVPVP